MYSIIVLTVLVLFFVAVTIEEGPPRYMTEQELIADPTKCKIMGDIDGIKLEDIAHSTNGITELSVFGHRDQNYRDSIRFAIDNFFYKSVHIHVFRDRAQLSYTEFPKLIFRSKFNYHENPLNMTEFVEIKIKLQFGFEWRLNVSLPNGAELFAVHKPANNFEIPFDLIHLYWMNNWYLKCPSPKMLSTESTPLESSTDQIISDFTFQPDTTAEHIQTQHGKISHRH